MLTDGPGGGEGPPPGRRVISADLAGIRRPPAAAPLWCAGVPRSAGRSARMRLRRRMTGRHPETTVIRRRVVHRPPARGVGLYGYRRMPLAALSYTGCRRAVYVISISLGRQARPYVTSVGLSGSDGEQSRMLSASTFRRAGPYVISVGRRAGPYVISVVVKACRAVCISVGFKASRAVCYQHRF